MVYNGNVPTKSGKHHFRSKNGPKMPKIGLDLGSFGLVSDGPVDGECLGTIRTIPDGI